jgi:tRNA-dihydrouridine synthase C
MIGRGAVTTPDLTQCIRQNIDTPLLTWNELLTLQIRFLNGGYKKEMNMVGRYKQWLGMMSKHYPEAKALWDEVKRIKPLDDIILKLNASAT